MNEQDLRQEERDAEFQHRLLELELATEGLAPVGVDPRAQSHGAEAFAARRAQCLSGDRESGRHRAVQASLSSARKGSGCCPGTAASG